MSKQDGEYATQDLDNASGDGEGAENTDWKRTYRALQKGEATQTEKKNP